jgi:hypothetical protein
MESPGTLSPPEPERTSGISRRLQHRCDVPNGIAFRSLPIPPESCRKTVDLSDRYLEGQHTISTAQPTEPYFYYNQGSHKPVSRVKIKHNFLCCDMVETLPLFWFPNPLNVKQLVAFQPQATCSHYAKHNSGVPTERHGIPLFHKPHFGTRCSDTVRAKPYMHAALPPQNAPTSHTFLTKRDQLKVFRMCAF